MYIMSEVNLHRQTRFQLGFPSNSLDKGKILILLSSNAILNPGKLKFKCEKLVLTSHICCCRTGKNGH